eukprot:15340692-Ditylum_brightwellii.AAC.1
MDTIRALEEMPPEDLLLWNGPLLIIHKVRQPGQWQVLSDMKKDGQNEFTVTDPDAYPCPMDILRDMYIGGYSAVMDISK